MRANELAHSISEETIAYRRDIHKHPEPSMKEFRTTDRICEELDKLGVSYRRTEPTGVIAELKGTKGDSDKIVMIRGDIDALDIQEKTDLDFASVNDGVMHACGHDTHNAMLLGAVKVLKEMQDEFAGTVRFVFQPGEEVALGAKAMLDQGCMEGVGYAFGIHISSTLENGWLSGMPGSSAAATDWFKIRVTGKTSHGAYPAGGVDALVCGTAIVQALQTMVSREYDPSDPLVVTVGSFHSGSRFNIIAGTCEMEGTCRMYSPEIHKNIDEVMTRIVKNVAAAYRCEAEVEYNKLLEPVVNDRDAYELGRAACEKVAPGKFVLAQPGMGGEDFGWYTTAEGSKCAFFSLGARWHDESKVYPQHHECVHFEEDALEVGVAAYAQLALDALEKLNG